MVDGLLCSIMKAISRSPPHAERVAIIEKNTCENEVKRSWEILFTHFDVVDPARKKKVIDIDRETTKKRIEDLVTQLSKVDKEECREMFVMPWSYIVKEFESESEERSRIWEQEKSNDYDFKIDKLEKKMDQKHKELLNAMHSMLQGAGKSQQQVSFTSNQGTYAGAVSLGNQGPQGLGQAHHHQVAEQSVGQGNHYLTVPSSVPGARWDSGASRQGSRGPNRSRSPSTKRLKSHDGSITEIVQPTYNPRNVKKSVIGTSDSKLNGRKMKSPPADIFVWGVHPETTVEDIINDLAASDIKVDAKDIVKKS